MGWVFMLLAVILFFLSGIGATLIPNPVTWGFFCMGLAFLMGGYGIPWVPQQKQPQ